MKVIFYLAMVASSAFSDPAGECDMFGFYRELGCTALGASGGNGTCPDAFHCPDLHPDPDLCYYKGVSYRDRDEIPENQIGNACSRGCRCRTGNSPKFVCGITDCPEYENGPVEGCIYTTELNTCCATGIVCGKDNLAKLRTCEVDGKVYREGQSFYPENTRKKCVCTAQWDGSVDNVHYCQDYDCGVEIHYQQEILEKCAPVFFDDATGCPIGYKCPSNKTKLVRGINDAGAKGECAFGNLKLSVGDEVTADETCVTCECKVPPLVTCLKTYCET